MRPEIVLKTRDTKDFIDLLTIEERGHLLTSIIHSEFGVDYKSGNYKTDLAITAYQTMSLGLNIKNKPHTFYFIELYDTINKERFLKIGVTSNLTNRIISFDNANLEATVIYTEEISTKKTALAKEKFIKRTFYYNQFEPSYKFGGSTECFKKECQDEMLKFIKDNG